MSVHQFPGVDKEKENLFTATEALEEIYDALNRLHNTLNELELRASEMEATYDMQLEKYIAKVGIANCPVQLLNYSMKAEDYYYEWKSENE